MIRIRIFKNKEEEIAGFTLSGHAEYAEEGADIVCSAVSVLALNTINAIELFTEEPFQVEADEKSGGYLSYRLTSADGFGADAQLLLKTMLHGFKDIEKEYKPYITILEKEVR